MDIVHIIIYTNILLWILPIFRQFNTRYWGFFLILGLSDPLHIGLWYILKIPINNYFILVSITQILTITKPQDRRSIILLSLIIIFVSIFHYQNENITSGIQILLELVILGIIINHTFLYIKKQRMVSLFLVCLISYQLSIIIKFIFIKSFAEPGIIYFYVTSALQMSFAILFTFYNIDNSPKYRIKIE